MSQVFAGTLLLPGEEGPGLAAVLEATEGEVTLTTGSEMLGSWTQDDCVVTPVDGGSFKVVLGGEMVLFTPESPDKFAEAMTDPGVDEIVTATPLAARIAAHGGHSTDPDAERDRLMPLISVAKGDEIFGRTVIIMIMAVSSVLIVALLLLTQSF